MSPEWVAAVAEVIINLVIAAFVYGRLTSTVGSLRDRATKIESENARLWETISRHGERIAKVETLTALKQ